MVPDTAGFSALAEAAPWVEDDFEMLCVSLFGTAAFTTCTAGCFETGWGALAGAAAWVGVAGRTDFAETAGEWSASWSFAGEGEAIREGSVPLAEEGVITMAAGDCAAGG